MSPVLSHLEHNVKPSTIFAISQKVRELIKDGQDIIDLSPGVPDLPPPTHLVNAACRRIQEGHTHYTSTQGILELRERLSQHYDELYHLKFSSEQIIVSSGAKQVITLAFMAILNPGDEVLLPAPFFSSYVDMLSLVSAQIKFIVAGKNNNFKITPQQLSDHITPKTRCIILNSPNNPTGAMYTPSELRALGDVLRQHPHVWIICDEIYEHIVFDNQPFVPLLSMTPQLQDRLLCVSGLSKSYAIPGWRLGYGLGPKSLIKLMANIQNHINSHPCSIMQYAALSIFDEKEASENFRHLALARYSQRRDMVYDILSQSVMLQCIKPDGAFFYYVNCEKAGTSLNGTDIDVVHYLLDKAKVAVIPGSGFGLSPYFRLSLAVGDDTLKKGCYRIVEALDSL